MSKPEWIARQSSHPRGWLGAIVSRVMVRDTARVNDAALASVAADTGEAILEIGCGAGRSLQRLAAKCPASSFAGIDPSAVMLAAARRRNAAPIAAGRVQVQAGVADAIPFADGSFDAAFSVHTLYFWPDLAAGLKEIRRVLRDTGRVLLVHRPLDDPRAADDLPASVYTLQPTEVLEKQLAECGFEAIHTELRGDAKSRLAFTSARGAVAAR